MLHVREGKIVMLAWSQKTVAIFINRNNFKILKGLSEAEADADPVIMEKKNIIIILNSSNDAHII
jgi:phosphatidate phosphatase PAH1